MLANWWRAAPLAIKGKYNHMVSRVGNVGLSLNQVKQDNTNIRLMGVNIVMRVNQLKYTAAL